MRALVTGASGFVGSHLVEHLVGRGDDVAILRRSGSDLGRLAGVLPAVSQVVGELGTIEDARGAIAEFRPEVVYHLAWSGVAGPRRDDAAQVEENLRGSLELLRIAAGAGCRAWVGLGSQAEYGPRQGAISEDDPTDPRSWYGLAKVCTGLLSRRLAADLGVRFAWLRLFSAYGPGDHPGALLPYLIRSLLAGERPALSSGEQRWDYLYVGDAAEAMRAVAASPRAEGVFNLGSGAARPLREVIERARDLVDPGLPLGFGERSPGPTPIMHLEADVRRLRDLAGWTPRTGLADGLRLTVDWHRRRAG